MHKLIIFVNLLYWFKGVFLVCLMKAEFSDKHSFSTLMILFSQKILKKIYLIKIKISGDFNALIAWGYFFINKYLNFNFSQFLERRKKTI